MRAPTLFLLIGCTPDDDETPPPVDEPPVETEEPADLSIPFGTAIVVDGDRAGEWDDAATVTLDAGWDVSVHAKWTEDALLVLFTNMTRGQAAFPELLIDP